MRPGQTKQFDTFDTLEDRRELVILFERLGEQGGGIECPRAREVRAKRMTGVSFDDAIISPPDACGDPLQALAITVGQP